MRRNHLAASSDSGNVTLSSSTEISSPFLLELHVQHFRIDLNVFANNRQNIAFQIR